MKRLDTQVDGVYSTVTSEIGSSIIPNEIELMIVLKTIAETSPVPAATGELSSSVQSIVLSAGNWIVITVTVTIGVLEGISLILT